MDKIPDGVDPREFFGTSHKERGPQRYEYTYDSVAALCGVAASTVRSRFSKMKLDIENLLHVATYVLARLGSRPLTDDDLRRVFLEDYERWENRWPRLEVFWCSLPTCEEIRIGPGLCETHGGNELVYLEKGKRPVLAIGKKHMSLAQLVAGAPQGTFTDPFRIRPKDGNPWNCRPENLLVTREVEVGFVKPEVEPESVT